MKDYKKVSNPLTIIAIFAGLAEVAGTGVMPFLSPELQRVFIWYVMGFPVLLVVLFFVVLLAKREVLYGPDDFKNPDHFMEFFKHTKKVEAVVQQVVKDNPEMAEKLEPIIQETSDFTKMIIETNIPSKSSIDLMSKIDRKIDDLVITELVRIFKRNIEWQGLDDIIDEYSLGGRAERELIINNLNRLVKIGVVETEGDGVKSCYRLSRNKLR